MSIPAVGAAGFIPTVPQTLPTTGVQATDPTSATNGVAGTQGADFGQLLSKGIENLQGLHNRTDQLAVQAATGDLNAIHDYTITATEASVATQLTAAVRNKALEAFQSIMQMQV
jgi:flagellar hook-basal body complex protein FliE